MPRRLSEQQPSQYVQPGSQAVADASVRRWSGRVTPSHMGGSSGSALASGGGRQVVYHGGVGPPSPPSRRHLIAFREDVSRA